MCLQTYIEMHENSHKVILNLSLPAKCIPEVSVTLISPFVFKTSLLPTNENKN